MCVCVCVRACVRARARACVCVSRMDGQTACLILTKIWEWIAIYPGGNIGGLKFTPHLSKWSPPREVDLENSPDESSAGHC